MTVGSCTKVRGLIPENGIITSPRIIQVATESPSFAETLRNFSFMDHMALWVDENDKLQHLLALYWPHLTPHWLWWLPSKSDFALQERRYHVVWPNRRTNPHGNVINLHCGCISFVLNLRHHPFVVDWPPRWECRLLWHPWGRISSFGFPYQHGPRQRAAGAEFCCIIHPSTVHYISWWNPMSFNTCRSHNMSCITQTDCSDQPNCGKIIDGTRNEPHAMIQTAAEAHESTTYAYRMKLSKVVWDIVPAWSSSPPTIVSRNGFAKNLTSWFWADGHN